MNKKQTATEWLAEKYNYVTWMRNRDEISAGIADEWRKHYLEVAMKMEREQIEKAYIGGMEFIPVDPSKYESDASDYYNETYGK